MLPGELWTDCKGVQARGTGWGWKEKTIYPPSQSPIHPSATHHIHCHLLKQLSKRTHAHTQLPIHFLASHPLIQPVIYTSTHPPMDPHPAPSHPVHQPFTVCIDMEMALQLPSPAWVLTLVLKAPLAFGPRGHLNTCHRLGFVFVTH